MRKTKILILSIITLLAACNSDKLDFDENAPNQVLMLQIDYTTNAFEGGKEFKFSQKTSSFTIENEYTPPSDFGSVKLTYKELEEPLFHGSIHWMGTGEMIFPDKLEPADRFKSAENSDILKPANGFEDIFNPDNRESDYEKPWETVQELVKVRDYMKINPNQKIKIFLYTPSVGAGDSETWKWIIYLKK